MHAWLADSVCRDAEIEVRVEQATALPRALRVERLGDAVCIGASGHARADFAEGMEVFERALRLLRHGDVTFRYPRRNQNAFATTGGDGLHLEVTIQSVERT